MRLRVDERFAALERLADGTPVRLRLLRPEDRARLAAGFERLSPASRFHRFLAPVPRLTERMLDQLTQTDGWNHLAIGAERVNADGSGGEGLGVARFVRLADAPETAEAAVAVVDEVQGRGLGRLLLTLLVEAACERGIRRFRAYVLPSNAPMRSVIRELDPQAAPRQEDGVLVYDVALPAASRAAVVQSPLYRLLRTAAAGLTTVWRGRPPAGGGSRS